MPFTKADIAVSQITNTQWKLLEPVVYEGRDSTFTVPRGYVTDFASVPRIFFWLLPSYGAYTKAAILHDFLCETKIVSRADADGLFRRTMRELHVPLLRRWIMWAAVRANSRLKGATVGEAATWLAVTIPAAIFLAIPAVVVLVWSVLFWLGELLFYCALKPFNRTRINPPTL